MITLDQVNSLDFEHFTEVFRNIVEHTPMVAAGMWSHRPYTNIEEVKQVLNQLIDSLPYDREYLLFLPCIANIFSGFTSGLENNTDKRTE